MSVYDEKLRELSRKVSRKKHLEYILSDLYKQKTELEKKAEELLKIKKREQADVERFEGKTLSALFCAVFGNKEERLEKERREAFEAEAKYDSAAFELYTVSGDINRFGKELGELSGCENEYKSYLVQKAEFLKKSGSESAGRIIALEEKISGLKNSEREIKEAISAGKIARNTAAEILDNLSSAEDWGTFDLIGGGLISDLAKYDSLDRAQELVKKLQSELRIFKAELSDVSVRGDIQVNIDGFLRFADYFFDGIFADWTVLDKIEKSKSSAEKTEKQIENIIGSLSERLSKNEEEINFAKTELEKAVIEAGT